VAEYITAALLVTARRQGRALDGSTIAVVGVGNVGSRVVRKCRALGMKCLLNDPPKQRESGDACYIPLAEALQEADFVTLHVPLERGGPDPTWRMVDQRFFEMLPDGAVFLNTSRGAVVCETDLKSALASGKVSLAVLDVWENEPSIDPELVDRTFLATPHIAGYSFDGKVAATAMLYEAYAAFLGQTADLTLSSLLPPPPVPFVDLSRSQGGDEDLVRQAVLSVYDIERDDEALRRAMLVETRGQEFDLVRKNYPNRREFYNTVVTVSKDRVAAARKLAGLGFTVTAA
jgi:erythronate-4-phosphate dehydrogenase